MVKKISQEQLDRENKRGRWSTKATELIMNCMNLGEDAHTIKEKLENMKPPCKRNLNTLVKYMTKLRMKVGLKQATDKIEGLSLGLRAKTFYPRLKSQFSADELEYFEELWVRYMEQFREDVLPSEEMQLKQLLTLEIFITRAVEDKRKLTRRIEKLQKILDAEYEKKDPDLKVIGNLQTDIDTIRDSLATHNKDYLNLIQEHRTLNKELKADRNQRIKRIDDSKSHWAGLLRLLDDAEIRSRVGEHIELRRVAKDKAKEKLSELHIYEDERADYPLLNADTILQVQGDENDEEDSN